MAPRSAAGDGQLCVTVLASFFTFVIELVQ
jgi:hypothetical protein